jgi:RNA polymerase sigma-32 factor
MARQIDPSLTHYITTARTYPELTREHEHELIVRWHTRQDEAAREVLVRAHLRSVVSIAAKYRRYGLPLAELAAEGNFGLVQALQKFDTRRGTRFVTYAAYWIRAYIFGYVLRSWSMVGGGSGALHSRMFFKIRRERVRIANLMGEGGQAEELLAKALSLPQAKVATMVRRLDVRDVSIDTQMFADSAVLSDTLVGYEVSPEESLITSEVGEYAREAVRIALAGLDARERYIVEKRLMADSEEELSLAELGRQLGVSRERARQLEERAKKKLRGRITELSRDSGWLDVHDAA